MSATKLSPKTTPDPPVLPPPPTGPCSVVDTGTVLAVSFFLDDPILIRRLKSRAGTMAMEDYLWQTIIKRAIYNEVF